MPNMFTTNWQPQLMPPTNMALQNNFNNFNMATMGLAQNYPPQNMQSPPQNYPPQNNFNQPPNNNFGQTPQPNMMMEQQFNNSNMGMNGGNNPYQGF